MVRGWWKSIKTWLGYEDEAGREEEIMSDPNRAPSTPPEAAAPPTVSAEPQSQAEVPTAQVEVGLSGEGPNLDDSKDSNKEPASAEPPKEPEVSDSRVSSPFIPIVDDDASSHMAPDAPPVVVTATQPTPVVDMEPTEASAERKSPSRTSSRSEEEEDTNREMPTRRSKRKTPPKAATTTTSTKRSKSTKSTSKKSAARKQPPSPKRRGDMSPSATSTSVSDTEVIDLTQSDSDVDDLPPKIVDGPLANLQEDDDEPEEAFVEICHHWSDEEKSKLEKLLVESEGDVDSLSLHFPDRSFADVCQRANEILAGQGNHQVILQGLEQFGRNWRKISTLLKGEDAASTETKCRSYISAVTEREAAWTAEESDQLGDAIKETHKDWDAIAGLFPPRCREDVVIEGTRLLSRKWTSRNKEMLIDSFMEHCCDFEAVASDLEYWTAAEIQAVAVELADHGEMIQEFLADPSCAGKPYRSGKWTQLEIDAFQKGYDEHGDNMEEIIRMLPTRRRAQVKDHYTSFWHTLVPDEFREDRLEHSNRTWKGPWSKEEEELFVSLVDKLGHDWKRIAKEIPRRDASQVCDHFEQLQSERGLSAWTAADVKFLKQGYRKYGKNWHRIQSEFLRRKTTNQVQTKGYAMLNAGKLVDEFTFDEDSDSEDLNRKPAPIISPPSKAKATTYPPASITTPTTAVATSSTMSPTSITTPPTEVARSSTMSPASTATPTAEVARSSTMSPTPTTNPTAEEGVGPSLSPVSITITDDPPKFLETVLPSTQTTTSLEATLRRVSLSPSEDTRKREAESPHVEEPVAKKAATKPKRRNRMMEQIRDFLTVPEGESPRKYDAIGERPKRNIIKPIRYVLSLDTYAGTRKKKPPSDVDSVASTEESSGDLESIDELRAETPEPFDEASCPASATKLAKDTLASFEEAWSLAESELGVTTEEIESGSEIRSANHGMRMSEMQASAQYGRLLPLATDRLNRDILDLQEDDIFVDIGHGIGNAVIQAAWTIGCQSRGIEVIESRHNWSVAFQRQMGEKVNGLADLRLGRLEDEKHLEFLSTGSGLIKAFANNFNGVFLDRCAKLGQKYYLDHCIAAIFSQMKPGSVLVTLHQLCDMPPARDDINEVRRRQKLPPYDHNNYTDEEKQDWESRASFYTMDAIPLGRANQCVSWSQNSGNNKNLMVYRYTRLAQPTDGATFLCTYPECSMAMTNATGNPAIKYVDMCRNSTEKTAVTNSACWACQRSTKRLRNRKGGDHSSCTEIEFE